MSKFKTNLKEWILLFLLEFVGTKNLETTLGLLSSETLTVALEKGKDILDNDCLEVDLFFVIEVIGLELDLCSIASQGGVSMCQLVREKRTHRTRDMSTFASSMAEVRPGNRRVKAN